MPDEGFSRFGLFVKKCEKKEEKEKEPQALSSYVSCGPLVKISSKTHVICAVYAQIAVRTSFAQICPRSRPIFPVFVEDRIPTTSNQKTLESNRVCRARHNHEINAFRERSRRIMYTSTSLSERIYFCLLYTSPSPRDRTRSRMPSSA